MHLSLVTISLSSSHKLFSTETAVGRLAHMHAFDVYVEITLLCIRFATEAAGVLNVRVDRGNMLFENPGVVEDFEADRALKLHFYVGRQSMPL